MGAERDTVSLRLVPGAASPKRPLPAGPFVERGHVEGLSSFDRNLLEMLFDDIAHAPSTDLVRLSDFSRAHPVGFWARLKAWRECVDGEMRRLRARGRLHVERGLLDHCRSELVDVLGDGTRTDGEWSQMAALALVAGLDDVVARSATQRWAQRDADHPSGASAVVWLACARTGKRTGLDVVRRLFSPLRPSSYPPAQYTTLVLPPHRRVRIIDDGSLHLGG